MSIFQDAHVTVLLADYIGLDSGGKVNALGAGFGLALVQPHGLTGPQYLIVLVDVPSKYAGQQYALSVELRDETTGQPMMIPTGPSGQLEPLRIQQAVPVQPVQVQGLYLPPGAVPSRHQMPIAFQDGLPLQPGHAYVWRVQIDGQGRPGWSAHFFVPGPPPGPVLGGPLGPSDIPNIQAPDEAAE